MKASKLFIAVAAIAVAGSAFASELPVASAAATSAVTAAQMSVATQKLNVPVLHVIKVNGSASRAQVHAEAVDTVREGRTTFSRYLDFVKGN